MALQIETIRATADRVAASHHLDVVELEFTGGAKHRTLRVFLEKDAEARAKFAAQAAEAAAKAESAAANAESAAANAESAAANAEDDAGDDIAPLPKGVPVEMLSFVTHEDCVAFATDFGTVLDIEDLIPGAEYTLEASSPGLERKLIKPTDFERFQGSLAKVQTFTAIDNNRHFTGRLTGFTGQAFTLDLSVVKQKSKGKKAPTAHLVEIPLSNVEKANLIAEI